MQLALSDLDELMGYIAEDSPQAAAAVAEKIWESTRVLSDHPAMGRPGRVSGTRELIVAGTAYIIPYRVVASEVQILRVLHGARKWPDRL